MGGDRGETLHWDVSRALSFPTRRSLYVAATVKTKAAVSGQEPGWSGATCQSWAHAACLLCSDTHLSLLSTVLPAQACPQASSFPPRTPQVFPLTWGHPEHVEVRIAIV